MIEALINAWPFGLAMVVLILFSAFFSGSEAALFSLSNRDRRVLARGGLGGRVATKLLESPERLLSAILFWNLLINMTYFALAAMLGSRLELDPNAGRSAAVAVTLLSLLMIIFFSEMLPKSFAVLIPVRLSVLVGVPLSVAVRFVSPVLPIVTQANSAVGRLVWPSFQPEPEIDLADIQRAIELGTDDASLLQRERLALRGLVQIAETTARELMQPRSKLWVSAEPINPEVIFKGPMKRSYLMVTDKNEMIVRSIAVRFLRPSQVDHINDASEPVIYVPWSAPVSQVLDQLNEHDRSVAVVVNEFGEALGALTIDDILRQVLLPRHEDDLLDEESIQQLGNGKYRVWGLVGIRTLAKELSLDFDGEGVTTVAGYVGRHNERLARLNDFAQLGSFRLTVTDADSDGVWIEVEPVDVEEDSSS